MNPAPIPGRITQLIISAGVDAGRIRDQLTGYVTPASLVQAEAARARIAAYMRDLKPFIRQAKAQMRGVA